jgi:Domain of unknown function (DUF1788)
MSVSSLEQSLKELERDLVAQPMRIAAHSEMPFAILRYDPTEEFALRRQLRLLTFSLAQNHHRTAVLISLSRLVWKIVERCEGTEYLFKTEQLRGVRAAQEHINRLLSSPDYRPIGDELMERIQPLDPTKHVVFLVRAGAFAPYIYRCSALLDSLLRRTMVPIVLFYPGSAETGTDLRFYNLPIDSNLGAYNYRVRVYGVEK